MSNQSKTKSKSVIVNRSLKFTPIIASDGILGHKKVSSLNENIAYSDTVIVVAEGLDFDGVARAVKDVIRRKRYTLPPVVLISAGNKDVSREGFIKGKSINKGVEKELRKAMVDELLGKMSIFKDYLSTQGGKLIIAPLIPRPADQSYENNTLTSRNLQILFSLVHLEMNKEIYRLNYSNKVQTPPINTYLEKSKSEQKTTHQKKSLHDTFPT